MSPSTLFDVRRAAQYGAGLLFARALRDIYGALTGDAPRGSPLALLERLVKQDRLTPEAALYLVAIAEALQEAGALAGSALQRAAWKERLQRLAEENGLPAFWARR